MLLWYGKQCEENIKCILDVWENSKKINKWLTNILEEAMGNCIIKTIIIYNILK
jgi:hypothetical protein